MIACRASVVRVVRSAQLCTALVWVLGCAVTQSNSDFAVTSPDPGQQQFLSSTELLVSGLVSESISIAGRGRLFEAESRLRKALFLAPTNPTIKYNLAVVLGQQGYADEALALLRDVIATQGDHPRYAIAKADVYVGQRQLASAREQLKLAFEAYSQAQNWPQAALIARSISNIAFADGAEQEALCYSYEALILDPSAAQLGYHASILVGLNLYATADSFIGEQLRVNPALGATPRVHLARALARGALGNMTGALDEIELAQDMLAEDPESGAEINVVWWLVRKEVPETPEDTEDTKLQESLEAVVPEVARLQEKPTYTMVRWPSRFLELLVSASVD